MPAVHGSAAQWDLPQHSHQRHRESKLAVHTWQQPHLQGGAHVQQLQPKPPAIIYTVLRAGPARPAAQWDRSPDLLPPPGGVRGARVRLGERQIRDHKQSQHRLPQGPAASLPWSVSINTGHWRTARPEVFFQLHHTVIKRYRLSLSAFSAGRFGILQKRLHIANESGKGVIQATAWGSKWLSGKGIWRQQAVTISQRVSAHIARRVVPPGKPKKSLSPEMPSLS